MINYKVFVIGSPTQHEDMVKLGEYQKNCLKDIYPNSVITVSIAETELEPDAPNAEIINEGRERPKSDCEREVQVIKKNLKHISESNIVLALKKEDGSFDKDTRYLMAFAEFLDKTVLPVKTNFLTKK